MEDIQIIIPDTNALNFDECADLKQFILDRGREATQSLDPSNDVMLVGSWFSINRKHSFHPNTQSFICNVEWRILCAGTRR